MQALRRLALLLAAAVALAACGNEAPVEPDPAAAKTAETAAAAEKASAALAEATKHMVSGYSPPGKPGAPVDLWWEMKDRPKAGEPMTIELAMVPRIDTTHLRATFIATDGLNVRPSPTPASFKDAEAGGIYRHSLAVVPREDGAYYVSVIVLMDLEGGPQARTFSMPVMVGAPADIAAKPQPATDSTGQPIEPMPAN